FLSHSGGLLDLSSDIYSQSKVVCVCVCLCVCAVSSEPYAECICLSELRRSFGGRLEDMYSTDGRNLDCNVSVWANRVPTIAPMTSYRMTSTLPAVVLTLQVSLALASLKAVGTFVLC